MFPYLSIYNHRNQSATYRKRFCRFTLARLAKSIDLSYFKNVLLCKFSHRVFRPSLEGVRAGCSPSSFLIHVCNIVRTCAKKQVSRVHTGRHIASMKNPKPISYRSVVQFPRKSMTTHFVGHAAGAKVSSAGSCVFRTNPNPTSWAFFDFYPKSLFCGHSARLTNFSGAVKRKVG